MEEAIKDEYVIFSYLGDLETAARLAKDGGLSGATIKEMEAAHSDLMALGALLSTEAHYKRLKVDVGGGLIEDLIKTSREGKEDIALGIVRQLRDNLRLFKLAV